MTESTRRIKKSFPNAFLNKVVKDDALYAMKDMPDQCIDLIVTSPPYNLKNSSGNGMKDGRGGKWSNAALLNGYEEHHDCMPHEEYVEWQRNCLTEMLRVTKNSGATFYNHKWRDKKEFYKIGMILFRVFPCGKLSFDVERGG